MVPSGASFFLWFVFKYSPTFERINNALSEIAVSFFQNGGKIVSGVSLHLSSNSNSKGPITKTYLYNFDPLIPHFYIVKLGFTRIHYFSYFCLKRQIVGIR